MTSLGIRVLADVIKFKMRSYWIRVGPDPMTVLIRGQFGHRDRRASHVKIETRREEHGVSTEAEMQRWTRLEAKEPQGLPAAPRSEERGME